MKALICKARDFRLTDNQEWALLTSSAVLVALLTMVLVGFMLGRKSMTSGEPMIVDRATYECKKTNELVGKSF
jgi:hypothetical protein